MDFAIPEDARELAGLARDIIADRLTPVRHKAVDLEPDRFDRELWTALGSAGVLDAEIGVLGDCAVLVEIGRAVVPVPFLASVAVGARALAAFAHPELASAAAAGTSVVSAALSEDLGEGADGLLARATADSDGWVLTGTKTAIAHGMLADLFLVPAATEDGPRVFLVRPDDPGVTRERQVGADGDGAAALELAGTRVGADRLLGGADTLDWLVARQTLASCAHQLGVLERALELTAAHAREREQFGRPIGSFQAVGQRLADAYIDVEAVRLTTWEAAWRLAEGLPCAAELATAKFWAADAGHRVAHTAVHIHGGSGIDVEGALHRYFTASRRNEFALGGATAQLRRLGAELAATPA